ncbi:MAG: prolipoprotein diacylglyceryl transferase [Hyphomicrobiaceae bacterium]|nr:prolipoprotein diacylglyceryl transferase [Hyphomicrobiaceae bacterium]MCC0007950.1 prolipoprotein diacylglyceryl transferase [Hyphomicrobiaceae bacterium]
MSPLAIPYPDIDPVAISLGPLSVKWYGLAYMAGLLIGWWYVKRLITTDRLWRNNTSPLPATMIDDLLLVVTLGVVVGGRLGHVLFYEPTYYLSRPLEILKIWQGGMAFHGGAIGVTLAMWLFSRRRHISMHSLADVVTAAVPVGLFFGRTANFINSEVVGTVSNVPWAMAFPGYGPEPRHPAMLYEAFLEGAALFAILYWLIWKRGSLRMPGMTVGAFLAGYGLFRMFVELFKIEEYGLPFEGVPITRGMLYSIPMVLLGAYLMWRAKVVAAREGEPEKAADAKSP